MLTATPDPHCSDPAQASAVKCGHSHSGITAPWDFWIIRGPIKEALGLTWSRDSYGAQTRPANRNKHALALLFVIMDEGLILNLVQVPSAYITVSVQFQRPIIAFRLLRMLLLKIFFFLSWLRIWMQMLNVCESQHHKFPEGLINVCTEQPNSSAICKHRLEMGLDLWSDLWPSLMILSEDSWIWNSLNCFFVFIMNHSFYSFPVDSTKPLSSRTFIKTIIFTSGSGLQDVTW